MLFISGFVFSIALMLAAAEWLCVAYRWRRLEFVFKPATLAAIIAAAWLLTRGAHDSWMARFFLPGLGLSLLGDVLLLLPGTQFFVLGLASFLLAHTCYSVGLNPTPPPWPAFGLLIPVAAIGALLHRPIAAALRRRGRTPLIAPVTVYTIVLCLLLFSAWATPFRPGFTPVRLALVVAGASLFFASDTLLAWHRFVAPLPGGRLPEMITYHLAQLALAAALWR